MNNLFIAFIITFAWSICDLQNASAKVRVIRSSQNSSRFVHHGHEKAERDYVTLEPNETNMCIEDTVNTSTEAFEDTTAQHRRRRELEVTTVYLKYNKNFPDESRSNRLRRNDETETSTNEYKKKLTDDFFNKIKIGRVIRRKNNGVDTESPSIFEDMQRGEFIEETVAGRSKGRRRHSDEITTKGEDLYSDVTDTSTKVEDLYSKEFINCVHTSIEKGCFEKLPNGSVYVQIYKRLFTPRNYVETVEGLIYVCPTFFEEVDSDTDKFPWAIYIVTLIGTLISTLCIVVHIIMFLILEKLRNLPGYCLFSMCIALMVAYICTVIPYFRKEPADCTAVGVIKAYGFLASFFWMNAMAYDIWRSLRLATAKLRLSGQRPIMTRFAMYSAYSWGCPLVIIIIGFLINSSEDSKVEYRLTITDDRCWFEYKQANLLYFASPLFTVIILNVLLFVSSFVMISSATMNTAENKADLWSRFLVSFRLAVVMGLMWIFGVLAPATEAEWLWYFFVIFNVLQGMFIFFSFTFTEKTRKEWRKALTTKKSSVFPTMTTTSSHPSTYI